MPHKLKLGYPTTGVGKKFEEKLAGSAPKKNTVNPHYTKALKRK